LTSCFLLKGCSAVDVRLFVALSTQVFVLQVCSQGFVPLEKEASVFG
jgi:hypothetical protein